MRRTFPVVLALSTSALAIAVGSAENRSGEGPPEDAPQRRAVTAEGQRLLDDGWEVMDLPELDDMRRQRAGRIDRSAGSSRELDRRGQNHVQDRIAPATWGLWSGW